MCCALSRSVVSESMRPYGRQPTRLLCPWDSLGRNTGAGCHFLLQGVFLTQGLNQHLLHLLHWQAGSLPPGREVSQDNLPISISLPENPILPYKAAPTGPRSYGLSISGGHYPVHHHGRQVLRVWKKFRPMVCRKEESDLESWHGPRSGSFFCSNCMLLIRGAGSYFNATEHFGFWRAFLEGKGSFLFSNLKSPGYHAEVHLRIHMLRVKGTQQGLWTVLKASKGGVAARK